MIEAEGITIAENSEEAFWINFKKDAQKDINTARRNIVINEHLIALADKKIEGENNGK